jgi:hypothetical protein
MPIQKRPPFLENIYTLQMDHDPQCASLTGKLIGCIGTWDGKKKSSMKGRKRKETRVHNYQQILL